MSTRQWGRRIALIALCLGLFACEERQQFPQALTTLVQTDRKRSDVCSIFPSLDRTSLPGVSNPAPDPSGRILAGYQTVFFPGAPPFACDRLYQISQQGVFRFSVASLRGSVPEPYRGAVLEITAFTPVGGGIRVVDAEPWGLGFGEGWIGSNRPRTTCQFRVMRAGQPWEGRMWGSSAIATQPLRSGRAAFNAPITSSVGFDVSQEVGAWFRGETPELGFVIVPDDPGINSKANNSCVGLFTVQLRAFFGNDR